MIARKRFVGWGDGLDRAEKDALEQLNYFIISTGADILETKINEGKRRGGYWCEIDLLYDDGDYEEEQSN